MIDRCQSLGCSGLLQFRPARSAAAIVRGLTDCGKTSGHDIGSRNFARFHSSGASLDARPNNGFAPGHSFGQYLSGLSRDYAATGNKATQEKVHRLVKNFAPAMTPHFWDDNRFPAYTYDKISIGMIDAHEFAA